jgi:LuxR family maltose regulon positive regulatory protein
MTAPLLITKYHTPSPRPNLVPRPRLIEKLNRALVLEHRLTLISAPAGFGKTTLLSDWAGTVERPVAWLSLDEGDNDPARFLAYLVAALQQVDKAIGQSALSFPRTPPMSLAAPPQVNEHANEALVAALVNDIAEAATPFVLALDDYHLIHASPIHHAIRLLLDHQPAQLLLAISTREDPPLPLPRLRARGQMTEVRTAELVLTEQEATTFLERTMGLHVSAEVVSALESRSEGWLAGLQMASLSLQDRQDTDVAVAAFSGDHRHVMDYMVEEVLQRQDKSLRTFLLQTSILDRMSGPLCDAVLKTDEPIDSQTVLEHLERANLFIVPLDNKRQWYRYHRLFADLLRSQLQRNHPELPADLHRQASAWHEQAGNVEEAVDHAFAIPDADLAAHLLEQYGAAILNDGRIATCLNWLEQIPDDIVYAHPQLCVGFGWALVLSGQVGPAEHYAQAAEAALPSYEPCYVASEGRVVTQQEIRCELLALRAHCARVQGDSASALELSQQALECIRVDDYTIRCAVILNLGLLHVEAWDWGAAQAAFAEAFEVAIKSEENVSVAVSAQSLLGDVHAVQGELEEAIDCYHRALELGSTSINASHPILAACTAHLGLAEVYRQRNETAAAFRHVNQGWELAQQAGSEGLIAEIYYLSRVHLALAAGDLEQARAFLDRLDALPNIPQDTPFGAQLAAARGGLYLAQGSVDAAARLVAARDLQLDEIAVARLPEYVLLVRVMVAQNRYDDALKLAEDVAAVAKTSRYATMTIEGTILQALAHHHKAKDVEALACLVRALDMAEPQGYIHPFLSIGEPVDKLLRQAIAHSIHSQHAHRVLAAFAAQARGTATSLKSDTEIPALVERLTERELQVLRLLATGLSSTETAEELVIAVSTVRSYIKVIYRKLDVHSRDEAIGRARELSLL